MCAPVCASVTVCTSTCVPRTVLCPTDLNTEDAASKPLCIACFHDALPVVRGDSSFKHRKVNEALVTSRGIRTRRLHKGVRKSIHKWRKEALEEGSGVAPTCSVCRQPTGLGIKEVLHDERWYRLCTDRRQLSVDSHAVQTLARQQETESTADDVRPSPYAAPSHSGSSTPTKKRAQRASGARANARLAGQVAKRLSCQYLPHDQQQEEQQEQESVQGDCEPSQNLASEEESGEQRHLMDISEEDYEPLSRGEETDTERECDGVQQSTPRPPANDADLEVVEPSAKRVRHRDAGDLHVLSPVAFRQRTSSSSQDTASAGQAAWQGGEVAQPQYPLGAAMHVLTRSKPVDDAMDMLAQSGGADRRGRPKPKAIPLSQQALLPPSSDLPKCRKRQVAQRHWARGLRDYLLAERLKNKIGDKQKHLFSQLSQSLKSASGLDFDNLLEGQASEFVVVKKPRKSRSRLTRSMWCDWSRWSGQRRGWVCNRGLSHCNCLTVFFLSFSSRSGAFSSPDGLGYCWISISNKCLLAPATLPAQCWIVCLVMNHAWIRNSCLTFFMFVCVRVCVHGCVCVCVCVRACVRALLLSF